MSNKKNCNLILIGHKFCGKTYFGKLLSAETGIPHIDTDELITNMYAAEFKQERTCKEIYLKIGERHFRDLEKRSVNSLLKAENAIISIGGGALLNAGNQSTLKAIGRLVYLEIEKSVLKEKILTARLPAFLDSGDPEGSFERMYLDRTPVYEKIHDIKLKMKGKNSKKIVEELKFFHYSNNKTPLSLSPTIN